MVVLIRVLAGGSGRLLSTSKQAYLYHIYVYYTDWGHMLTTGVTNRKQFSLKDSQHKPILQALRHHQRH